RKCIIGSVIVVPSVRFELRNPNLSENHGDHLRPQLHHLVGHDHQQSAASIDDQFMICREHASRHGWSIVGAYQDAAISGASVILRPGIKSLLADAQAGRFDVILAEALDRVSRDQADVATMFKHFKFCGVKLITLSEGEISELHVGLKGTMNALFLKDLALKTHRGQRGRVEKGKASGNVSYGYDVVKKFDAAGDAVRGERMINETEASIVRRIFSEFANGRSPRAIAVGLNRDGIPGPTGKTWSNQTIRGHADRQAGILRNELYAGIMVWNRKHHVKNPATGKRLPRMNPESEWIRIEVPELRIIDEDLWNAVRSQMAEVRRQFRPDIDGTPVPKSKFRTFRRPRYLLSGLIECGVCGRQMAIIVEDRYGCPNKYRRGTCTNNRTIRRGFIEDRALKGLSYRLISDASVKEAVEAFGREIETADQERKSRAAASIRDLSKLDRAISGILSAIEDGMYQPSMKARLAELEQQKAVLENALDQTDPIMPEVKHNFAERYRDKIRYLTSTLDDPELRDSVSRDIRSMIKNIRIFSTLTNGKVDATLSGDLAGILSLTEGRSEPIHNLMTPKAVASPRDT
uniref:recombinase family protein n=1 Tax=Sphingobium sp. WCS2017Hpa-17 TaxID=3073638 RepID=UPI002889EC7E